MSGLISVDEAWARLAANTPKPETEIIPIADALGRRLAEDVYATVSKPSAAVSAMDGYAVRLDDVREPHARLRVIGTSPAGHPFDGEIRHGEAVRIFTGGEVPAGADHIVIQEDVTREGDEILCALTYSAPRHIRPAGQDFNAGDLLVSSGTRLKPGDLSLIAAANVAEVLVYKQLRVGILSNGDELKPPGSDLKPGEIVNSNPAALAALVTQWGGVPVQLGIARDSVEDIQSRIQGAENIDIFVPVGGASVGDHDHMRPAFKALGFAPVFEKVAVKPGKPTWLFRSENAVALGLPGNPASAYVCAQLFLRPLVESAGVPTLIHAKITTALSDVSSRDEFLRANLEFTEDAELNISPVSDQDSSLIHPLSRCNALIRRPARSGSLENGEIVPVLLLTR